MMKRLFFLLILLVGGLLFVSTTNFVQETNVMAQSAILQKENLEAELIKLNDTYRGQLSEYRLAERNFLIARDQYNQLQTLASINEVVESARTVMSLRNQVLITYLDLLRINLIAAEGVEISLKQLVLERLETQRKWLQAHQQALAATSDREQFNRLSDTFIDQTENLIAVSQQTVSLLSLGKLQNVFDRLVLFNQSLVIEEASVSGKQAGSNIALTERALRETERLNQSLATLLQTNWSNLDVGLKEDSISGFYGNLSKALDPIYTDLNKLVAFLQERLGQL